MHTDERHYPRKDGGQEWAGKTKNSIHRQHQGMDKSKQQRDLYHDRKQRRIESSSPEGSAGSKRFNKPHSLIIIIILILKTREHNVFKVLILPLLLVSQNDDRKIFIEK